MIEINGKEVYIYRKGKETPKLGVGLLKEVVQGVHLNRVKPVVQGTIRLKERKNLPLKNLTEGLKLELELQKMFTGSERVVQLFHICTTRAKSESIQKVEITMENCEKGDLFGLYEGDELDLPAIYSIAGDLLEILVTLEEKQVLHRDLKPENLFVTKDLRVKVGDFGLSGTVDGELKRLQDPSEEIGGSIEYLSPEVAEFAASERTEELIKNVCSTKTMIWSMGVILYDLLLGDLPPFAYNENIYSLDEESLQVMLQIEVNLEEEPLFKLICQMLQFNPENRPSGAELKEQFSVPFK